MTADRLSAHPPSTHSADADAAPEEDPTSLLFKSRLGSAENKLSALLGTAGDGSDALLANKDGPPASAEVPPAGVLDQKRGVKRPARAIDEDDYGDDEDDEEEDANNVSPLKAKSAAAPHINNSLSVPPMSPMPKKPRIDRQPSNASSSEQAKSAEDVRKKLEEEKKAAEDAAKKSFHTYIYTLESDKDAMLEQQKLDELDRQVENEISGQNGASANNTAGARPQQGTLGSTNLGASSLTLKHLIAKIDAKRDQVKASDAQLRNLISEVRKKSSKWASEDRIGQGELYEACEKVLMELKAMTEYAAPFLQKVNKREAPDYYTIIKHPMDIGTMIKKLKSFSYKSKKEFTDDLNLIWANCLKYNADPNHFLRKKAVHMRKETEKLTPLIPDIVIRDRAEVEAEERRLQHGDADLDGAEDSEDEEPIMASRGRKAPKKGANTARKAPAAGADGSPAPEVKPPPGALHGSGSLSNLKHEFLRAESDAPMDGSQTGLSTPPPPGSTTPLAPNGIYGSGAPGSQADLAETDGVASTMSGLHGIEDPDQDDQEFKTWKQVTKKDRALAAAERNRLFQGGQLNPEMPALLRSKIGMRRFMRHQKIAKGEQTAEDEQEEKAGKDGERSAPGETLAEGIEGEEERFLPDYYDPVNAIPELTDRLKWEEDNEGHVIMQSEETLRLVQSGQYTCPDSALTRKMDANMRQMQETRKVVAKIGVVKQMQLQAQTYQNQFQKYDPEPFVEADIGPTVVSDEGPIMSQGLCRSALQRSVGKICYHAGFEEFQPSALEAITDIASKYMTNLVKTLGVYSEAPKVPVTQDQDANAGDSAQYKPRFTAEETVLHMLYQNGLDLDSLESYCKEDVERLGSKLGIMHDRMKSHLADLLRPALSENAGVDGVGAFNDGSEQFVGGDFAEDIDEDFFGFKELGLDQELGLESLNVPFHLLQNRMHSAFQAQNTSAATTSGVLFEDPPKWAPITKEDVGQQIGLVEEWFQNRLHKNNDQPLIEDEDLPSKQRFPKPRLPPSGKISSPRKRPIKEQQASAKKKRKMEEANGNGPQVNGIINGEGSAVNGAPKGPGRPLKKLKLDMPGAKDTSADVDKDVEKDGNKDEEKDVDKEPGSAVGMMSPESIGA
ncbi:MAG: Transcriptional activator spt7 [Bathelium mastoideum]|nr:MAG: Transcriptional activator spt7 [Bathelium mastoideum]